MANLAVAKGQVAENHQANPAVAESHLNFQAKWVVAAVGRS